MRPIQRALVDGRVMTQGLGLGTSFRCGGGFVVYGLDKLRSSDWLITGLP
jgi:hypothetical protein